MGSGRSKGQWDDVNQLLKPEGEIEGDKITTRSKLIGPLRDNSLNKLYARGNETIPGHYQRVSEKRRAGEEQLIHYSAEKDKSSGARQPLKMIKVKAVTQRGEEGTKTSKVVQEERHLGRTEVRP